MRPRAGAAAPVGRLLVLHRRATPDTDGAVHPRAVDSTSRQDPQPQWLRIRTCQREIRLALVTAGPEPDARAAPHGSVEAYRAAEAYRFLLEFASGLRSAVPGETNVFGQVREAWRRFERQQPRECVRALAPLMDALFRDVREVRTRFLQGIGGQSYATLARRLLAPDAASRVLIVGFGALGRSMPAMFAHAEVAVFNRTRPSPAPGPQIRYFGAGEERQAAAWATHVVMCVPRRADIDTCWIEALRPRNPRIVHLGCRRGAAGGWSEIADLIDLDAVFDLQREQGHRRESQLRHAREACATLAGRAVSGVLL